MFTYGTRSRVMTSELGQLMGFGAGSPLQNKLRRDQRLSLELRDGLEKFGRIVTPNGWLLAECWGCDERNCLLCNGWPNFYYAPHGLKISWYKYPLRSATSNSEDYSYMTETVLQFLDEADEWCSRMQYETW